MQIQVYEVCKYGQEMVHGVGPWSEIHKSLCNCPEVEDRDMVNRVEARVMQKK